MSAGQVYLSRLADPYPCSRVSAARMTGRCLQNHRLVTSIQKSLLLSRTVRRSFEVGQLRGVNVRPASSQKFFPREARMISSLPVKNQSRMARRELYRRALGQRGGRRLLLKSVRNTKGRCGYDFQLREYSLPVSQEIQSAPIAIRSLVPSRPRPRRRTSGGLI